MTHLREDARQQTQLVIVYWTLTCGASREAKAHAITDVMTEVLGKAVTEQDTFEPPINRIFSVIYQWKYGDGETQVPK